LVFKWNECDIPLKDVLECTTEKPLFGHPSGKAQKTHWVCFMKIKDSPIVDKKKIKPSHNSEKNITALTILDEILT
jgi:hypothetical protein